jgi:ribosomal-protein-serine acetyltransferase
MMATEKVNPILLDIPIEFTSQRLLMRVPRPGDGVIIWPAIQHSFPELKRWMP